MHPALRLVLALCALLSIPAAAAAQPDAGVQDAQVPDVGVPATPLPPNVGAPNVAASTGTRTVAAGEYQIWVRGPLGERLVSEVAAVGHPGVFACHRRELALDGDSPRPATNVMVRMHVARDGRVRAAFVQRGNASLQSEAAIRCVQDAVQRWRFPVRREESVIDYAFTFHAAQAQAGNERNAQARAVPTGAPVMPAGTPRIAAVDQDSLAPAAPRAGNLSVQAQVRIATTEAEVQGGLFGEDAHRVVRARQGDVRACYDTALRESGEAAGRLTLAIIVAPNGSVARATVQGSTTGDETLDRCISDAARRWRFPPPRQGQSASLRYPITLSASAR